MAIIQSYPINDNVKDTDLLLGVTNIAPSGNPIYQTKSFRVSDVRGGSISVSSVFGRTGNVVAVAGDYTTALVTETTNKKYQTDLQALYNDATSSIQTQINNRQARLNGNGLVRMSGTIVSYDNSVYALDNSVVKLTGIQVIEGAKFFTSSIKVSNTTNDGFISEVSGVSTEYLAETIKVTNKQGGGSVTLRLRPVGLSTGIDRNINIPNANGVFVLMSSFEGMPATPTSTGTLGEIRCNQDYMYVCIQNNVWRRVPLLTW